MWPVAFTLPNALRAANDVRMPMVTSGLFNGGIQDSVQCHSGIHFQMGVIVRSLDSDDHGLDIRLTLFILRYREGKWETDESDIRTGENSMGSRFDFYIPSATVFPESSQDPLAFLIRTRSRCNTDITWHAGACRAVALFAEAMNEKELPLDGPIIWDMENSASRLPGNIFRPDGAFYVLEDIRRISDFTERQYPSVPRISYSVTVWDPFVEAFSDYLRGQVWTVR